MKPDPIPVPIIISGSIAVDRIMNYPGKFADIIQPDKLHVLSLSVLLDKLQDTRGGVAANIAYNLALLGDQPILYGAVGNDVKDYMNSLAKLGVNTAHLRFSKLPTATFTVMTDLADCQIGGFYPGAMTEGKKLSFKSFNDQNAFFVISPHDPVGMAKQVAEVKKYQLRMLYDIGQQVSNVDVEDLKAGLDAAEVLIVNDYELGVIEKRARKKLEDLIDQIKVVIVTLGEKGAIVIEDGKTKKIKAVKLSKKQVADPTGAGDAFRAGFLYGHTRSWPAVKSAQLGAVVASFAIQKHGTQEHKFSKSQIDKILMETYKEEDNLGYTA